MVAEKSETAAYVHPFDGQANFKFFVPFIIYDWAIFVILNIFLKFLFL